MPERYSDYFHAPTNPELKQALEEVAALQEVSAAHMLRLIVRTYCEDKLGRTLSAKPSSTL